MLTPLNGDPAGVANKLNALHFLVFADRMVGDAAAQARRACLQFLRYCRPAAQLK